MGEFNDLPVVVQRFGYRKAIGINILLTFPSVNGMERALAKQVGAEKQGCNHTVFQVYRADCEGYLFLWFVDGKMHVCEGMKEIGD